MRTIVLAMVLVGMVGSVLGCEDRVVVRRPAREVVVVHPVVRGEVIVR
jgi:hypothetical protein